MIFPNNFIFGAATSAYQIEGASLENGRVPSIWDSFCQSENKIIDASDGSIACDSYHRIDEDISLMKKIGLNSYRFSIAWPRIIKDLNGTINDKGIKFYQDLLDKLNQNGIKPCVTLYHWDLPQFLQDEGGWLNPNTALKFNQYVEVIVNALKGKVFDIITFNELECSVWLGYGKAEHAPGYCLSENEQFICWRNIIYAHCLACKTIRQINSSIKLGIATTGRVCFPCDENSEKDISAAYEEMFSLDDGEWGFTHTLALDPICFGHYPKNVKGKNLQEQIDKIPQFMIDALKDGDVDFISLNIYNGSKIKHTDHGPCYVAPERGAEHTAMGWPITPPCLKWGPLFIQQRYHKPLYISENGISCTDKIYLDGKIHDQDRIDFIKRHLLALLEGIEKGSNVKGYYYWSLMDNFEWAYGYTQRFGLIFVNYENDNQRLLKDSAYWYQNLIKTKQI